MKIHIGGSFQPAVVDTNRSRRGDPKMLWRKYSKIQTTSQTLNKAHHLLTSMNIPNEET